MPPLRVRQTQIYWLEDCDPLDGDAETDRPVIVLSTAEMLKSGRFARVVACSTHPRKRDVPRILIPDRRQEPATGLPRKCWALPRWYLQINPHRLRTLSGSCPEPLFAHVQSAVMAQVEADTKAAEAADPGTG